MTVPQSVCITDTNVWLDLHAGKVLGLVLQPWAEIQLVVTDLLLAEDAMASLRLTLEVSSVQVRPMDGDEVERIAALGNQYPAPSVADLSGLVASLADAAVLVTGDAALRRAAEAEEAEVHGTLWLLDQCVATGHISPRQAVAALRSMLAHQPRRRLPDADVQLRLHRWSSAP